MDECVAARHHLALAYHCPLYLAYSAVDDEVLGHAFGETSASEVQPFLTTSEVDLLRAYSCGAVVVCSLGKQRPAWMPGSN